MTDPLGFINRPSNVGSVGGTSPSAIGAGGGGVGNAKVDPNQPSFKDMLMANISEANALQSDANRAIEDLTTGKRGDLEGVLLATQKADTAFRTLLAVRNKVQAAYEEIKQLRV